MRRRSPRVAGLGAAVALLLATGCGAGGSVPAAASPAAAHRAALARYVIQIEPLRRSVNHLLEGADPILGGLRDGALPVRTARRRMARLERRFAHAGRAVAALHSGWPALERLHRAYAGTYPFEDRYLRALTAAIPTRSFARLPHTAARQRRALVAWRVGIKAESRRLGVRLPADIGVAGRGEIAPSPDGS